jgi:hypothetical protein
MTKTLQKSLSNFKITPETGSMSSEQMSPEEKKTMELKLETISRQIEEKQQLIICLQDCLRVQNELIQEKKPDLNLTQNTWKQHENESRYIMRFLYDLNEEFTALELKLHTGECKPEDFKNSVLKIIGKAEIKEETRDKHLIVITKQYLNTARDVIKSTPENYKLPIRHISLHHAPTLDRKGEMRHSHVGMRTPIATQVS